MNFDGFYILIYIMYYTYRWIWILITSNVYNIKQIGIGIVPIPICTLLNHIDNYQLSLIS